MHGQMTSQGMVVNVVWNDVTYKVMQEQLRAQFTWPHHFSLFD